MEKDDLKKKLKSEIGNTIIYDFFEENTLKILKEISEIDLKNFLEINNDKIDYTGAKMWPAEEALAFFCLENYDNFVGKNVCELGAGYSGLASLGILLRTNCDLELKKSNKSIEILITDGNNKCVQKLRENLLLNSKLLTFFSYEEVEKNKPNSVAIEQLIWSSDFKSEKKYERVIAADCLFFVDFHFELIHTINELLDNGEDSYALIIAPKRGTSLNLFLERCRDTFAVDYLIPGEKLSLKMKKIETFENFNRDSDFLYILRLKKKINK